jgi:hypothetical protein
MKINGVEFREPIIKWWKKYTLWQYTSNGVCPGITGRVDLSDTYMSLEELKKYGKISPISVPITPEVQSVTPESKTPQNAPQEQIDHIPDVSKMVVDIAEDINVIEPEQQLEELEQGQEIENNAPILDTRASADPKPLWKILLNIINNFLSKQK